MTGAAWTSTSYAAFAGAWLAALLQTGAPAWPSTADGCRVGHRPATAADGYAVTERWCALVLRAFISPADAEEALRTLLAEEERLTALLTALDLGGADAGRALLRVFFPPSAGESRS